jgi:hypothetical protein
MSEDARRLVLAEDVPEAADTGERFEVVLDDRLRTAVRGGSTRAGGELEPGHELPPRVIQARIRAGETPEQVAHASGTRVERIMRFAHPVLQERARVAEQAQQARVRLSEGTPSSPLEQFLSERLRLLGADLDAVRWDAFRTDDGTWQVKAAWRAGHKSGTTRWSYDVPARTVTPVDAATMDFAEGTRLVRVVPDVPTGAPPPPPPPPRAARPVAAVPDAPGPAPADAADEGPGGAAGGTAGRDAGRDPGEGPGDGGPVGTEGVDVVIDDTSEHDTVVLDRLLEDETVPGEDEDPRARIPAWEDIVFGVRRNR